MTQDAYARFADLTFEDFRRLAGDERLSRYERIGFPDAYREGREVAIFSDILAKLPALRGRGKTILDIGPGCSDLPQMLIEYCQAHEHTLVLLDSAEMLAQLPAANGVQKIAGFYPECAPALSAMAGRIDAIICYSVFHYIFAEASSWEFIDRSIELLAPGGRMLVGDIPNVSMRKRFFASEAGAAFHHAFTGQTEPPDVAFNCVEPGKVDDAVLLGLVMRARQQGADAWLLPQPDDLPMANRREDLVISRP